MGVGMGGQFEGTWFLMWGKVFLGNMFNGIIVTDCASVSC